VTESAGGIRRARALGAPRLTGPAWTGFWFSLPAWVLILAVAVVPMATTVYLSFTSENLARPGATRWLGLGNYQRQVLAPDFVHAAWITALIAVGGLLVQVPIGMALALAIRRLATNSRLLRSSLLLPTMLAPVAVGLIWSLLLNSDIGVVHEALSQVGMPSTDWLGSPGLALLWVVLVSSWQNIGFVMLMFLAGLANLPQSPLEAALIDGASAWQTLRYIILPMLAPIILIILLIRGIDAAKMFDLILILTGGGPGRATENLNLDVYETAFQGFAIGQGAALAVALAIVLSPLYILWRRVTRA
jgi:multiple sugar transport system permease protein